MSEAMSLEEPQIADELLHCGNWIDGP